jgi:acyl transferase domain-containing protein
MLIDRIAIIGIGCRFPGGINDHQSFWKLLVEGREAVGEVPADRWNIERFYDAEQGVVGKSITRRGGFLDSIDQFDPQFFGISPREAPYVDPQQRLLLETAWEAIEDAGLVLDLERGSDVGVFVGISHNDYQIIQGTPWDSTGISPHSPTGSAHSIAANRISYCFNLRGPSIAMDTACSSALTAVHAACEYIRAGRGDMALAGGVTVMITPGGFIGFSQASMLSPDGKCKAFDASANGFVRGEGAGMVLLKRLSQAIADGDPIHGVIIGTALNQDGHTNGISLPSAEAQARLVRDACADAGIEPSQITFIEAHGTGTAVGDPIEAHALAEALCVDRPADAPLLIGSVKTNLGHLETAAGVAGLLKAVLVLQHRQIPASLHFETPNPHIDFAALKLRVPTALESLPQSDGPQFVGVNSFGFGGANAHVILEEPPLAPHPENTFAPAERAWPVVLSARSEEALRGAALRLAAWVDERSHANGSSPMLPDLVYSLGARRNHHPHRLTVVASSMQELAQELDGFAIKQDSSKVRTAFVPRPEQPPRVAFVMSGQGPQWWGMGRELMEHEPIFRQTLERCGAATRPWARFSLLEELGRSEETSRMHLTEIAQPAIFAMQMSLAELWKSWGVQPAAVVGHSVGEIAAACVAGVFTLEEGARIIALRARFMGDCARGEGTMLAVGLGEDEARALIARHDRTVTIAVFNGPRSLTLAGSRLSLEAMLAELEPQGVFARLMRVDHRYHHPLMQSASEQLEEALADLRPQVDTIPFFSTVKRRALSRRNVQRSLLGRGVRQPVRFASAVNALADFGVDDNGWKSARIPRSGIRCRNVSRDAAARCRCCRPYAANASTSRYRDGDGSAPRLCGAGFRGDDTIATAALAARLRLGKNRWWSEARRLARGPSWEPEARGCWTSDYHAQHQLGRRDSMVATWLSSKITQNREYVIFPAAAFVDMVLEAGVQLFEGRALCAWRISRFANR